MILFSMVVIFFSLFELKRARSGINSRPCELTCLLAVNCKLFTASQSFLSNPYNDKLSCKWKGNRLLYSFPMISFC